MTTITFEDHGGKTELDEYTSSPVKGSARRASPGRNGSRNGSDLESSRRARCFNGGSLPGSEKRLTNVLVYYYNSIES